MKKLIVFDVDGTLIDTKIGSFKDIGVILGKEAEIKAHTKEYEKRKHLGPWGLEELAAIFSDVKEEEMKKSAEKIVKEKLITGVKETILKLKEKGYVIVSYSSSPIWIMDALKQEFGFEEVCGNVLEVKDRKITGKLLEKVDRYVKAERLKKFMDANSIAKENTFVVGDSVTDLPMAEHGHFIAFNCKKQAVREKAEHIVDKKDLREILKFID